MRSLILAAFAALMFSPALAQEKTREAQVGILRCSVEGGGGFIIGSRKDLTCIFERSDGRPNETYTGNISKFGIDIGKTKASKLTWGVFAPSKAVETTGRLAGTYGGVSGEATVGVGLGANVLIGGFGESVALQPLSVQSQKGINIAAGIASLTLTAVN
ncbi:DUF992 domain-containing protein [Stappia sp. GBMRC 2046]|uniref:DUF992 domain-containing protein n=1 Tax=Stappia sediminis TaxID=2692190 RepID=A0A7X3S9K1_9HYPH|nr:DUF992 domain-containing protein [Stappia sediminis]MXN66932.1 DUF992 domain-containing protein [Stappia sediminis]